MSRKRTAMTTLGKVNGTRWGKVAVAVAVALALLVVLVLLGRWLRTIPGVESFVDAYPGEPELPASAPVGLPAWLGWQHFLNFFLLVLIIRSGWLIRTSTRPAGHWTRNNKGLLRTKRPPTRISLNLWLHLALDWLWLLNGAVFVVLLFTTGQWMRVVPTSWEVFPHALSVSLQYLSLDWPMENGWVNYNALQVLAYFVTIFLAAPLAAVTGLRMSPIWRGDWERLNRVYPIELARAVHFPVMIYFVLFIVVHVTLVLTTGALRNLNHMYAARDDGSWWGLLFFGLSLVVVVAGWVLARPIFLRPVASLTGKVTR